MCEWVSCTWSIVNHHVVGNVLQDLSCKIWHFFRNVLFEITGRRESWKGLEVPCIYCFIGMERFIAKKTWRTSGKYVQTLGLLFILVWSYHGTLSSLLNTRFSSILSIYIHGYWYRVQAKRKLTFGSQPRWQKLDHKHKLILSQDRKKWKKNENRKM